MLPLLSPVSYAKELGTVGAVYPIKENDALEEIEERVKQKDWGKYFNDRQEKIKSFKPEGLNELVRAKENKTYTVDMTYTLNFDIPDGKGGILYPKGYTFNPLDYVIFPKTLVFIDADDKKQLSWLKTSEYNKDEKVILLITGGSYYKVMEELKRPVFYADKVILDKFKIQAVPAIVTQKGRGMEVREIAIKAD